MKTTLNDILFEKGDYQAKAEYINSLTCDELMAIPESTIIKIIEQVGENSTLTIRSRFRKGNNSNSEVENAYIHKGGVFLTLTVLGDSTDTSMSEYFAMFFRKGEFVSNANRLYLFIDYKESDKAEVMRSILLEGVYRLDNDEDKAQEQIAKLTDYRLLNPIFDYFYDKHKLKLKDISKHSSRNEVATIKAYHRAECVLRDYIKEHYKSLAERERTTLEGIYKEVFAQAMQDYIKNFDYDAWRKDTFLFN